jgi:hypothetical protein
MSKILLPTFEVGLPQLMRLVAGDGGGLVFRRVHAMFAAASLLAISSALPTLPPGCEHAARANRPAIHNPSRSSRTAGQ